MSDDWATAEAAISAMWKKRRVDWTVHTTGLLLSAAKEYHAQKRNAS
jgi:hypothetical protein